jgi:CheY-like chemotaxis protein
MEKVGRLLVVEDSRAIADVLHGYLSLAEYRVTSASDGISALARRNGADVTLECSRPGNGSRFAVTFARRESNGADRIGRPSKASEPAAVPSHDGYATPRP